MHTRNTIGRASGSCARGLFLPSSIMATSLLLAGCSGGGGPSDPGDADETSDPNIPQGYVIADPIDPHLRELADLLIEQGADVVTWASTALVAEDYAGHLRSPTAVLASGMGNDVDRCVMVHHLLSAAGIYSRYTVAGDDCVVEALIDGDEVQVATSQNDSTTIMKPSSTASSAIEDADRHQVEFYERIWPSGDPVGATDSVLGSLDLATLTATPVTANYVEQDDGVHLRVRIGRPSDSSEQTWHGAVLNDAARHALVIRHIAPDGQTTEHVRGLFDSTADVGNLSPDVEVDIYAIWFGAGLVGPSYLRIESDLADLEDGTGETADYLRLRAVELAVESDNAAWRMFEDAGEEGIVSYDTMRVIVAAQERQSADDSGPVVPSLDLLANTRRIYGHDDPISMQIALGLTDAMTEGMVLERATGLPAMTVPQILASHFQEESNDLASRLEFFEDALQRLWEEGVTEEGLTLFDPQSDAEATVWLIGAELLLALTDEQAATLETAAGEAWDGLETTIDGLVLDTGSDRAWPIELLLLQSGASLDYVPQIRHIESPQGALATPSGSVVEGTATYLDESFAIHAIARMFEEAEDPSDPESKRDVADWHLTDDAGTIIGSGTSDEDTATLSESKPRILQFGEDDQTSSFYLSSLWIAPAVAAGVRAGTPTDCWFAYDTGGAAEWVKTELTQFTHEKRTLLVNGQSVGVAVIVAGDQDATHFVTIARYGLSRLVLALTTPVGESQIESIVTPRELRLRGRVMSWRGSTDARSQQAHAIGVADAELFGSSDIGTSWPDGTVDLHVPDSANPTLTGSIAILVDTSNSMEQPADPDCTGDPCTSKIDVVAGALATIIQNTPEDIELAVWGFESSYDNECAEQIRERAPWSLDRDSTLDALQYFDEVYLTGGTPLTGAVQAALDEMGDASWGASRRLIVLADGDNDCDAGLDGVIIPANIQIYTIGLGLMEGSDAEQQLTDLASRARGTYTRTTNGEDLSDSLTAVGALPLPDPEGPEDVPVTITAANHLATQVDWPVDSDDVIIYLNEDPDRTDLPGLVTIQPGESFPSADVDLTDFAVARIEECRSRRPEVLIIVPDRMVDIGLTENTLGWLEIDPETGYTTAVTLDGLHGSSPVGTHGAIIAGMWSGVNSVMGGFSSCVVDYGEDGTGTGCGSSAAEITASICGSIQGDAGTWMTYLGSALGGITGLSNFNYFFQAGASTVEVVCNSGLPGSTLAQVDFSLNTLGHGISQLCGVLTSNAATLHSWAVCYLVGVGSDIAG